MTPEEKARAYDEALERAKEWKEKYDSIISSDGTMAKDFDSIFPQLRESEDEKTRKEKIEFIRSQIEDGNYVGWDRWIAYLEKHKESLHIPETCKENADSFTYESERIRKALINHFKSHSSLVGENWNGIECDDIIAYLEKQKEEEGYEAIPVESTLEYKLGFKAGKESEKQKEQKPNIELIQRSWYMEGYHDRKFDNEPKWIIKTGEGGPRFEENPRYGQPLAEEQKPKRERHKPKESWLSKAKYELAHEEELLIKRQKELSEIRALKNKEQKPAESGCTNDESEYDKGYREGHKFGLKQTQEYMLPGGRTFSGLIPCWVNAPSELQPAHKYHGKNVVVMHENNGGFRCVCIDDEKPVTFHLPEDTLFVEGWRKKPAEWSEEDERMRQTAIEACKTVAADYENSNARFYKCKGWLEFLPERFVLQPKQEWSEEDTEMLNSIINVVCGIGN